MAHFTVQLTNGETVTIAEADAYQFEGPLTTFFSTGSSRQVIDSWSTRIASYRTADVVAIERFDIVLPLATEPLAAEPLTTEPRPTEPLAAEPTAELVAASAA